MKKPLGIDILRSVYDRSAGHYDCLHSFLTLNSDDRGRRLVVEALAKTCTSDVQVFGLSGN